MKPKNPTPVLPGLFEVPTRALPHGKTRSTGEAMSLLKRWRSARITEAREIARSLIHAHGSTHSREVLTAMEEAGLLDDARIPDYWLGAVFRTAEFYWTGQWYKYSDDRVIERRGTERNIHERTIKVWSLKAAS